MQMDISGVSNKEHLVVIMHGVMGAPMHMQVLSNEIQQELGENALIYLPSCYSRFSSLKGTVFAGDAVFAQMQILMDKHKATLKFVSLIGYSFGGVVATWVAGRLQTAGFCGLTPEHFITIACPHLGATDPDSSDGSLFQRYRRFFIRNAGGTTGIELSHGDSLGLLPWMADPASPFFAGLRAFRSRAVYANLRGDRTVPFATAYFPAAGEAPPDLPGRWQPAGPDFPHVLTASGAPSPLDAGLMDVPGCVRAEMALALPLVLVWLAVATPLVLLFILGMAACRCARRPDPALPPELAPPAGWAGGGRGVQERMGRSLGSLAWRKQGVLFTWRRDGLAAVHTHGHIVVRSRAINGVGADVVRHVAAAFRPASDMSADGPKIAV
jgi:hypothetical protein